MGVTEFQNIDSLTFSHSPCTSPSEHFEKMGK